MAVRTAAISPEPDRNAASSQACPRGDLRGRDGRLEGVALLDELKRHALQDKYLFSYAYEVGDVVLWDDLATLHSATLTDPNDPRTLWRITVKEPVGAFA